MEGIDSTGLCSQAGLNGNLIPSRFLLPIIDCSKFPAQESILTGWESIPGLYKRFTNMGSISPVLAYLYDLGGFVGAKKKTILGLLVFDPLWVTPISRDKIISK
jgi:hypothetical protein